MKTDLHYTAIILLAILVIIAVLVVVRSLTGANPELVAGFLVLGACCCAMLTVFRR